jgi:hypothetical protein
MKNTFIWAGLILAFITNSFSRVVNIETAVYIFVMAIAFGAILYGCYMWTRIKNRHWLFMLWGLLSPIGLLGISLLKDKSVSPVVEK